MCTIKFSIELNTFQTDDKYRYYYTNNICEKSVQIFKMDDSSVSHQPVYVSYLDDSLMRHLPGKVLTIHEQFCISKSQITRKLRAQTSENDIPSVINRLMSSS